MAPGLSAGQGFGPVCNKGVEAFLVARRRDRHRRIVASSRARIDNGWSQNEERRLQASKTNAKRHQTEDERLSGINKENGRLVLRMHEIDHRREPLSARTSSSQVVAQLVLGGAPLSARTSSVPAGSNVRGRANEFARIDDENQKLLRRLHGARPTVDAKAMEDRYQEQQKVMRMRCELQPEPLQSHRVPAIEAEVSRETAVSPRVLLLAGPIDDGKFPGVRRPVLEEVQASHVGTPLGVASRDIIDELFAQRRCLDKTERDAEIAAMAAKVVLARAIDQGEGHIGYADFVQRERSVLEAIAA